MKKEISIKSIFTRLIITFLLILIPIYLLSIGIQAWGRSIIENEITNSMSSQTDYYRINLESELVRIQNLETESISDTDLLKLANISEALSDFERAQIMNRLSSKMYSIKNSSIYIDNAVVIIPSVGKSISANDGISDISAAEQSIVDNFKDEQNMKLISENNTLYLRIRNIAYDWLSPPRFVIQVEFSNAMLQQSLMTYNKYEGSGLLLFYPEQNYILNTGGNILMEDKLISAITASNSEDPNFNNIFTADTTDYLAFFSKMDSRDFWFAIYVPINEVYSPLNIYKYLLWLFTIISLFIIALFSYTTHQFINRPMKNIVNAFHRVEAGDMKYFIEHKTNDEFQYLYQRFNAMLNYVNNLIEQVYAQKIMSQKAELQQLQSQINPHFLYNSFFIMQRMIQGDEKDGAIKFCGYLGKYFQYITKNIKDELPLSEEIEHARNYMDILSIRFSNTIFEFGELPEKYKNLIVPRLILQPIIENSFEHAFNKKVATRHISINFKDENEGLYCIVEDNGSNVEDSDLDKLNNIFLSEGIEKTESTGLYNIHKRIMIKFGGNSGLKFSRSDMGGWKTEIFFDMKEETESDV